MARILIASQSIAGHVYPLTAVAGELSARGHEVRWYSGRKYAPQITATGARHEPFTLARDYDDAAFDLAFPGRAARRGLRQVQFDVQHLFVGQIEPQLRDLQAVARQWPWDVTLADQTVSAALLLEELGGPPCALLGVLPLGVWHPDAAPFGLGLAPMRGRVGRARNAALRAVTQRVIFGAASRDLSGVCQRLGVAQRPFEPPLPTRLLQASVPEFEYPLPYPPQVQFVGALVPPAPLARALPDWWADVTRAERPVVVVTQGTLATDPRDLIAPTLEALAGEDVLVVAAGVHPSSLSLPANARAAPFVPFPALLPHAHVFVTNGGYGGVQLALSHDLPVVACGVTEDKMEVARRVQVARVGVGLARRSPAPGTVRRAVRRLLGDPDLRAGAARVGAALRTHDAPREVADALEAMT